MNTSLFDTLTRELGRARTRREALKALVATGLGGMFSFLGIGTSFASICTGGQPGQACASSKPHCCNNSTCSNGTCVCENGLALCGNNCVDLQTNMKNCGACGQACVSGQTCVGGVCTGCPRGQTNCNGTCVNVKTDPQNCGACGVICGSGSSCKKGLCCPNEQSNCHGACVNSKTDPNNCGGCGIVCSGGQVCQNSQCVTTCLGLQQPCASPSDCCGSASGQVTCTNTNCSAASVCCTLVGSCSGDCDCCGGICDPSTNTCTCFTAGTLIAMADGTSRPIERILAGDLVLGNAGRVNRVTEVLQPVLGHRHLYSLNESNFFVTAGHPFMTEEGWKAIDPTATPAEHSGLHVGRLTVGDRLLTLTAAAVPVGTGRAISAEAVDVRVDAVVLQSLVGQSADPATQLYNLRLDGDHTYFANDLLVHNK